MFTNITESTYGSFRNGLGFAQVETTICLTFYQRYIIPGAVRFGFLVNICTGTGAAGILQAI